MKIILFFPHQKRKFFFFSKKAKRAITMMENVEKILKTTASFITLLDNTPAKLKSSKFLVFAHNTYSSCFWCWIMLVFIGSEYFDIFVVPFQLYSQQIDNLYSCFVLFKTFPTFIFLFNFFFFTLQKFLIFVFLQLFVV